MASPILSIAASQSSVVASAGSMPSAFITRGTVSRSSETSSTRPLYCGSKMSLTEVISGASSVFTIRPVIPPCQGIEKSWSGSVSEGRRSGLIRESAGSSASLSSFWM